MKLTHGMRQAEQPKPEPTSEAPTNRPTFEVDCHAEAAEIDRLRAENASLRHALTVVRAELETALRHLRGC